MEWISVNDEYPTNGQKVKIKMLNNFTNEIDEVEAVFKDTEYYCSWSIEYPNKKEGKYQYTGNPTHWIPLQEPPKVNNA